MSAKRSEEQSPVFDVLVAEHDPFDDLVVIERHYATFAPEANGVEGIEGAPTVNVTRVVRGVALLFESVVAPVKEQVVAMLTDRHAEVVRVAMERIIPLCYALFYAQAMRHVFGDSSAGTLSDKLRESWARAIELGKLGRFWLDLFERSGLITHAKAAEIRRGRGLVDLASDLAIYWTLFSAKFDKIEAGNALIEDESKRLTRELIDEMGQAATALSLFVGRKVGDVPASEVDWKRQVAALFHLLEKDYARVRAAVRCYLELEGRAPEAEPLGPFRGLASLDPYGHDRPSAPEKPDRPPKPSTTPQASPQGTPTVG